MTASDFPALLQTFFIDRLLMQRQASPHTIKAYRATFRVLVRFAAERLRRAPSNGGLVNLNVHFHLVVPDGVFVTDGDGLRFELHPVPTSATCSRSSIGSSRRARTGPGRSGDDVALAGRRQAHRTRR